MRPSFNPRISCTHLYNPFHMLRYRRTDDADLVELDGGARFACISGALSKIPPRLTEFFVLANRCNCCCIFVDRSVDGLSILNSHKALLRCHVFYTIDPWLRVECDRVF